MQTSCTTYLHCSLAWFPGCERALLEVVRLWDISMETNIFLVGTNGVTPIAEACNKILGGLAFCVPRVWQSLSFHCFNPSLRYGPCLMDIF